MKWRRALLPASRDEISLTVASQNLVRPEFLRISKRPRLPEGHGATVAGAASEAINYRNIDSQFHELMIQYEHDFAR